MSTSIDADNAGRAGFKPDLSDQPFFTAMSMVLAGVIVLGFVQFTLRGFVEINALPWWVHAHAVFMIIWLTVYVTQNILAENGAFDQHRKLGWLALLAVAGIGIFGSLAGIQALALHRIPPFFTDAYFLALTQVEIALFVGTVLWGVALRGHTQWHRRVMLGATVLLMEPALGRLLPMPLLGGAGEWFALAIQLVPLAVLAWHDQSVISKVHPATLSSTAIVIGSHIAVSGLSMLPAVTSVANRIAGH